jgi:hypothetical protein
VKLFSPQYHEAPVICTPEEVGLVTLREEVADALRVATPILGFWVRLLLPSLADCSRAAASIKLRERSCLLPGRAKRSTEQQRTWCFFGRAVSVLSVNCADVCVHHFLELRVTYSPPLVKSSSD